MVDSATECGGFHLVTAVPTLKWICPFNRFLPVRREFFIPTVPKCLLTEGRLIVGVSLYYIGSLLYNIKDTEVTFVVIWAI